MLFAALGRRVAARALASQALSSRGGVGGGAFGCGLVTMAAAASSPGAAGALAAEPPAPGKVRLAVLQVLVGDDKAANLRGAEAAVRDAAAGGAQLVCLPECFNSPYGPSYFPEYAEEVPASGAAASAAEHPSTHMLCSVARELGIFLVGGSIPERDAATGKLYNSCLVVGPDGAILCKHRKVHLFDIDVPGGITFRESDTLSGGDRLSLFDTPWGRVGVGICYDIRFPSLAACMRKHGAHLLVYPGAFNMTTGPVHWELLARARAVDNQAFVATPSPARNPDASYTAWGHSSVVSPWGRVLASVDTPEQGAATVMVDVDLAEVLPMRQAIPVFEQERSDLYELKWVGGE